jgi:nitrite reductase/ring-hydroxylating ferredoxin subunit
MPNGAPHPLPPPLRRRRTLVPRARRPLKGHAGDERSNQAGEIAMPDESARPVVAQWTRIADLDRVHASRPIAVKLAGKQIALFLHEGEVYACNNRCPHEGYPLVEGELDADCVLTCHWHNWKFDLRSGATIYGGDNLRVYPVKVEDRAIWVDLRDPPAAERIERALAHLDEAMAEYDTARIARELARLVKAGAKPEVAFARVIAATYDRLRDGMTHAYAAAEAWLRLADRLTDDATRLACATEAIAHIAYDTLRERKYRFATGCAAWDAREFAAAVEAQDEARSATLINGALAQGLDFAAIEGALADAALAHYNDFGHSLIYLMHVRRLIERLGPVVERPLLLAWLRSLIYATREDLLPDFRGYVEALAAWPAAAARPASSPGAEALEGLSIGKTLDAAVAGAGADPLDVYYALMEAAARHLLRFDERHALRTDVSVADNVGWLDFSHALTFGHALREQCLRQPHLWPQGLLQLALFVGRNSGYLSKDASGEAALREWDVRDERAFNASAMALIVDHGIGLPIFPAHWLKTWTAVRDESEAGIPASTRAAMLAAANRLLAARFKERHALRTAHQALGFVARED